MTKLRKTSLLLASVLILTMLLAACGIDQEDYDTVIAERDTLLAEMQKVAPSLNIETILRHRS